ncbi:helix-turn-helix protein [Novosphingobium sp. PhB57]|jgi:AraC-like DNA-binding protein|uniref:AraC family transcriptional regulator n=1 Tax=unclassified Novosphingobium TaxID=2644732 RepID=UPI0010D7A293|nr:AraC family transcriptional regulator [Novosphingobium sp. PhB57]TCU57875.1 helix-turn-helix protein [Novosphingobium sp. PhB57]
MTFMQDTLNRMCRRVERHIPGPSRDMPADMPVPRLRVHMACEAGGTISSRYEPMICLVLRGAKQVTIGNRVLRYDAATCFVTSVEVAAVGCVTEASRERPYIVTTLALNREVLAELLAELPRSSGPSEPAGPLAGFGVAPVTREILDAWEQLLALLDSPADIPILGPAREREVLYRLLQSGHGGMLRQIGREDSRLSRTRRAIECIRRNFDQPLRTEALAEIAGMSVPSFHRHFKAATGMSPLQYQKSLRLQTARRLLTASPDAARAAFAVGYESASQFSREYARQFGSPPTRDAARMREATSERFDLT